MANEKRLIDANAFECVCVNGKSDDFCNGVLYVLDMIDAQPTVDAVEVVRCKDCRTCAIYDDLITRQPQYVCRMARDYREVEADGFCSRGERRKPDGLL